MIALVKSSPKIHHIWVVEHPPVFTIGISEKNIEEDKEFKEMNAWSEKEDIVALDIMKKKKDSKHFFILLSKKN